jgi:tetratricopeptide (TPR) repeat protein
MSGKNQEKTAILGYIYKTINPYFWDNVLASKDFFQEIFVFNFTEEPLNTSEPNIKIIQAESENFPEFMADFFYYKRFHANFLLVLEDTDKILFKEPPEVVFANLKDDKAYNVQIVPQEHEVFEYETEPFTGKELRLFSLKIKELKDVIAKCDFYYQEDGETVNSLVIHKKEIDSDFEIFKAKRFEKEEMTQRDYFYLAVAYFYKDSLVSENYFRKVLEIETGNSLYRGAAFGLLLKLLFRRQEFSVVLNLTEQYKNFAGESQLYWVYKAMSHLAADDHLKALNSFNKALKLKEKLPFLYNYSDLNWKLYSYIGEIFYRRKRYKNAEKYFLIANDCLTDRKSPDVFLSLAKLEFYMEKYEEAFNFFKQLFAQPLIPAKVLNAARETFLNLLLFVEFKDESLTILNKDCFDSAEEILRVADTFYMNENFIEALKIYHLIIKKFGVENKLLFKLGYICSKLRILDQACLHFERFLEREPGDLDALNNLAFLYLNRDMLDEAEKIYLRILDLNNYSFEANLHLAIIFMSKRNRARAKQYLDKAKTLNPASQEVIRLHKIYSNEFK